MKFLLTITVLLFTTTSIVCAQQKPQTYKKQATKIVAKKKSSVYKPTYWNRYYIQKFIDFVQTHGVRIGNLYSVVIDDSITLEYVYDKGTIRVDKMVVYINKDIYYADNSFDNIAFRSMTSKDRIYYVQEYFSSALRDISTWSIDQRPGISEKQQYTQLYQKGRDYQKSQNTVPQNPDQTSSPENIDNTISWKDSKEPLDSLLDMIIFYTTTHGIKHNNGYSYYNQTNKYLFHYTTVNNQTLFTIQQDLKTITLSVYDTKTVEYGGWLYTDKKGRKPTWHDLEELYYLLITKNTSSNTTQQAL